MENRPRMTSSRKGDIAASSYRQQPALLIDPFRQAASYVDRIQRGENPPTFRCRRRPTAPRTNSMIEESATSVMALLGPPKMSDLSQQSGAKRTLIRSLSPVA